MSVTLQETGKHDPHAGLFTALQQIFTVRWQPLPLEALALVGPQSSSHRRLYCRPHPTTSVKHQTALQHAACILVSLSPQNMLHEATPTVSTTKQVTSSTRSSHMRSKCAQR